MRREQTAASPATLRAMNAGLLLERLFSRGTAARGDLARTSGLSKPTVSAALADLEAAGLVRLVGSVEGRPGPAATLYDANARAGLVAGNDIGRQFVRVAVADLRGAVLARRDARNAARTAGELVKRVDALVRAAAAEAGLSWPDVTRAVLASPGVLDPATGRLRFAGNLPGWGQRGLVDRLQATLGVSLAVHNDINLAALAEHAEGVARGCRHFVLLSVGTGVGMGIVIDGQLYAGAGGAAGEVAYLPADGSSPSPGGGRARERLAHGMTESLLSARGVVAAAHEAGLSADTAREVFDAAAAGDPCARGVVRTMGRRLATLVVSIAAVLDPELVVLSGGVGHNLSLLRPGMDERIRELSPLRPRIAVSALQEEGALRGAVTVAAREAREVLFDRWLEGQRSTR
jgi:predicted NBD/HSP70 family sugar kinase